ncbi:hypothetical protein VKT23_004995 [Stygiomarasmius scandens]|uniref:Uncharacterized protein n=1 Tax=Marasmiellus scandens TaxID=2682957 RepID=A0ABR1JUP2_9AGAR
MALKIGIQPSFFVARRLTSFTSARDSFAFFQAYGSFPDIPPGGASLLERAEIIITPQDKSWNWFCSVLQSSSKLRELRSSRKDLSVPWHDLERVTLFHRAGANITDCYNILATAHQLECADIFIASTTISTFSSPLQHNLTKLILATYFSIDTLLDSLKLPLLQTLSLQCYAHKGEIAVSYSNLASFLTRSSCSLKVLDLSKIEFDDRETRLCLEHSAIRNSLVELSLAGSLNIACLAVPSDANVPCLVPNLEGLQLEAVVPIICKEGVLSEVVMSRVDSTLTPAKARRLKNITIDLGSTRNHFELDIARLQGLQTPGLDFSLKITTDYDRVTSLKSPR